MRRRATPAAEGAAGTGHCPHAPVGSPAWRWFAGRLFILLLVVASASVVSHRGAATSGAGSRAIPQSEVAPPADTALPAAWTGATGIVMNVGTCPDSAGICGESNVKLTPAGATDLESLAFGAQTPTTISSGAGPTSGRPQFDKVIVTKGLDTATPALLRFMVESRVIRAVTLTLYMSTSVGPQIVSKYTLNDVFVTDYKIKDGADHDETFSLVFSQVKFEYFPKATGSSAPQPLPFCWNVVNNVSC